MRRGRVVLSHILEWGRGEAYWVYDHVVAAKAGALLMVPAGIVDGSLKGLCALCPVPYESALAVMDQAGTLDFADVLALELAAPAAWPFVREMAGQGAWFAARLAEFRSRVYRHELGTRLAVADEFLVRETLRRSHEDQAA